MAISDAHTESVTIADAQNVGKRLVANLLSREHMYYGTEALHYSEAATAVGALRFVAKNNDAKSEAKLVDRYSTLLDDDSPLVSRRAHVDMNVIGIVPLQVAIRTSDDRFLNQGLSFADQQWEDPLDDGLTRQSRWWIDDLYMVGMLQIQAYRATGEMQYADRAARQLAAYLPELQRDNGLFYHSPDAPIFWGRGNGWVAVAMAEVLTSLPRDHPLYSQLELHYGQMMSELIPHQAADGMWRQVVDHERSWPESSSTAMFAYAMVVGIQSNILKREPYLEAVKRAWAALTSRIGTNGNINAVCVGTGKSADLQYYLDRPTVVGDFHGQAPMLWLATALLDCSLCSDVHSDKATDEAARNPGT